MVRVHYPPSSTGGVGYNTIFLAGSIEGGKARQWQDEVIEEIGRDLIASKMDYKTVDVLNPRRKDWDTTWLQDMSNPSFFQQVTWELDNLKHASSVLFYFEPNTLSPISLMELGEVDKRKNITVVCPEGFWRKGNVDIYCDRHRIPQFKTLDEAVEQYIKSL